MPVKTVAKSSKHAMPIVKTRVGPGGIRARHPGESQLSKPRRQYAEDEVGDAEDAALSNAVSRAAARASAK